VGRGFASILPPAPPRLSTTIGVSRMADIFAATIRTMVSLEPPARIGGNHPDRPVGIILSGRRLNKQREAEQQRKARPT